MPTLNGWMGVLPGDPVPMLTVGQRNLVLDTVHDRIMRMNESEPVREFVLEMVTRAMENVPDCRSCLSCDYFRENGFCVLWNEDVPEETIPVGCDSWQDDGTPF